MGDLPQIRVDLPGRRVLLGERELRLSRLELDVLVVLARRAGEVVSYADLGQEVWRSTEVARSTMAMSIGRLRSELGDVYRDQYIVNIRGVGYRLNQGTLAGVAEAPARGETSRLSPGALAEVEALAETLKGALESLDLRVEGLVERRVAEELRRRGAPSAS